MSPLRARQHTKKVDFADPEGIQERTVYGKEKAWQRLQY